MSHFQKFIHDHLDAIQVVGAGGGGTALMLSNIETSIKILIGLATLGYILHKWYLMYKKNKNETPTRPKI